MTREILKLLDIYKPTTILDCTFGAGGHSKLFLDHGCKVISLDYDNKVELLAQDIVNPNFTFHKDNFSNAYKYIDKVDLVFADLGLSSMQIDQADGFAFSRCSPLNMQADTDVDPLYHTLKTMPEDTMAHILHSYGNVRNSIKIAHRICTYRLGNNIHTTYDLKKSTGIVKPSLLAPIFQAFRIYHNNEVENLEKLVHTIYECKKSFIFITFHSIEGKIVKDLRKKTLRSGVYSTSKYEIKHNSRSRSAILNYGCFTTNLLNQKIDF